MENSQEETDPGEIIHYGCIQGLIMGELDDIREIFADDLDYTNLEGEQGDLDDMVEEAAMFQEAFPDIEADIEEMIVEDQSVAFEFTTRGTHEGTMQGIPPTGNEVAARGMGFATVEEGLITEYKIVFDRYGMFEQLGLV